MYWMQNNQSSNSPVPVIQQVQATGTQPVQQAPGLLDPIENKPITKDAYVPQERIEIQQVSLLYEETDPKINRISVLKDGSEVTVLKETGDTDTKNTELAGPKATIQVTIDSSISSSDALLLIIDDEEISATTKTPQANPTVFEFTITKTGDYELKYKKDVLDKFTINNVEQNQAAPPVITSLSDTTSPEIVYPSLPSSPTNSKVFATPCFLLRGANVTLNVSKEKDRNIVLEYRKIDSAPGGDDVFKTMTTTPPSETDGQTKYEIPTLSPGVYQFRLKDTWFSETDKGISNVVTVAVPQPDAINPLKPSLTSYKNQLYSNELTVTTNPIQVFGGYLVLKGKNANPKQSLNFEMFYTKDGHLERIDPQNFEVAYQSDQTGDWNATLKLGDNLEGPRTLYIVRQEDARFAYSNAIPLNLQPAQLPPNPVELTQFKIDQSGKLQDLSNDARIYINTFSPVIKVEANNIPNTQYLLYTDKMDAPLGYGNFTDQLTAKIITPLADGQHTVHVRLSQGNLISDKPGQSFTLNIQKNGFEIVDVQPPNFGTVPRADKLKIQFSETNLLSDKDFTLPGTGNLELDRFELIPSTGTSNFLIGTAIIPTEGKYEIDDNSIILTFTNLPTNLYQLVIKGNQVTDIFGNRLEGIKGKPGTNYTRVLNKPASEPADTEETDTSPTKFIEYHDYEKRESPEDGFNPSDKVVTRVARLYYFRDAHHVAQILNSEVKSLNQKGYDEAQITADRARVTYEETAKKRRIQERKSIQSAKDLRAVESDYRTQQQILSGLVRERAQLSGEDSSDKKERLETAITAAQGQITSLRTDITRLSGLMNDEDQKLQELTLVEENQSAELFRREVQAEKTDLYTIGNGDPKSYDAVRQVTIKVIGEGLIHLRGPIKGVNLVRIMINQIDSPVGQVRIAMHTIQINGEDGKRMEIVADRIQKSIDQSRFLTVQSSQMLRKAIITVASEVATSTCQDGIALSQEERDQKYLHAFFGQDFIEALRAMDSEFLQSGNKLLSIHSMDTTSLSSALFVLALAKNEIRQQILAQFYASIETQLPEAECQFLFQGGPTKQTKHKLNLLAPYAHFQSFKGFFDHEVVGTDTMTPIQREFLRLAQIFKARLTTEREYNLHIMERAVIEQREGDYEQELLDAKEREKTAKEKLAEVQTSIQQSQLKVINASTGLQANISSLSTDFRNISSEFDSFQISFFEIINSVARAIDPASNFNIASLTPDEQKEFLKIWFPLEPESGSLKLPTNSNFLISGSRTLREKKDLPIEAMALLDNSLHIKKVIDPKIQQQVSNLNRLAELDMDNPEKEEIIKAITPSIKNSPLWNTNNKSLDTQLLMNLNNKIKINEVETSSSDEKKEDAQKQSPINKLKLTEAESEAYKRLFEAQFREDITKTEGNFTYGKTTFRFKFIPVIDGDKPTDLIEFILVNEQDYKKIVQITAAYQKQAKRVIQKCKWFHLPPSLEPNLVQATTFLDSIEHTRESVLSDIHRIAAAYSLLKPVSQYISIEAQVILKGIQEVIDLLSKAGTDVNLIQQAVQKWRDVNNLALSKIKPGNEFYSSVLKLFKEVNTTFNNLAASALELKFAQQNADASRQKLDHKKFLDMQIDETEDKFIELMEGTRAHTANIDNYLKLIATALEDDFNTQFYYPAFKEARDASRYWNVTFGSMETSSILTNNRSMGKVAPKATIEFDLPKRQLAIIEGMNIAHASVKEYGALVNDPTFLAITSMNGGENVQGGFTIEPDSLEKRMLGEPGSQGQKFGSAFENLIPDPAVFKFETGTGFTVRPVIQPDGQAVVFDLNYLYRTNVREPVRADEKHLGRIKEHFIDTDVQLGNYELREISRFMISLKASRTANGVPLLSDVPGVGVLFRPTPSAESSLQQSQIMSQAVIYPTLFDLMGLRWAPAVADVGPLQLINRDFISKGRDRYLKNRVYDYAGSQVDKFLQIPDTERRSDLYRTQQAIPDVHPNGYMGPGLNLKRSTIEENFDTERMNPQENFIPEQHPEGVIDRDQAIPLTPPAEQRQLPPVPFGNRSSALPVKDPYFKPVSWDSPETKTTRAPSKRTVPSPRHSHRPVIGQAAAGRITPKPVSRNRERIRLNQESQKQPEEKADSLYKRSAARFKSFFNK